MTGNVRKLAFDLGFLGLLPFLILVALSSDYLYLSDNQLSIAMNGGFMFALLGNSSRGKTALWRTLPVTDREIGRARWWQAIGLPGIGIVVTMGAGLALNALITAAGWAHLPPPPGAGDILRALLVQFFYPVFFTVASLATIFARTRRSPFAYLAAVAVWAPWLLVLTHTVPMPAQDRLLLLGPIGVLTAIILYATAPSWPQPPAQPLQLDLGGGNRVSTSRRPGQNGWASLCGMALIRPVLALAAVMAFWVAAVLALNLRDMVDILVYQFIPFAVIQLMARFNAGVLRLLRPLPGSAVQLTAYLFLLPLALLAAASASVSLLVMPWLTGEAPQLDVVALAAALLVSAPVLPAALGLRQMAMGLVVSLTMVLVPLIRFGWHYVPPPWQNENLLLAATAAMILAGFFWMHIRISRSTSVYRFQPFVEPRWRGND
jgi:hypothetical protein